MTSGSDSSSEDEDLSRFQSVAVTTEHVTAAAQAARPHKAEASNPGIVEKKLYEALAARLGDDSGCERDELGRLGEDSGCDSNKSRDQAFSGKGSDDRLPAGHTLRLFKGTPQGLPIAFQPSASTAPPAMQGREPGIEPLRPTAAPLTRRERVRAMKQEARRERKAAEKAAKAAVLAEKQVAAARRRGEPVLPPPPVDKVLDALRAIDTSTAHFGVIAKADAYSGNTVQQAEHKEGGDRPSSMAEAAELGIEVTDAERKAFRRQWRIAKNERRKARSAISRTARQAQKTAHYQVKCKIKKEKQARKDRAAQRDKDAAAAAAAAAGPLANNDATPLSNSSGAGGQTIFKQQPKRKEPRKKISVRRGKFSRRRCVKRNKELKQAKVKTKGRTK